MKIDIWRNSTLVDDSDFNKHGMKQNISTIDLLMAHIRYWKHFTEMLLKVRSTYLNSSKVLIAALRGQFPIDSRLKNGISIKLKSFNAMYLLSHIYNIKNIQYDIDNDVVTLLSTNSMETKNIILHGGINNGDIVYGFLNNDYGRLPVKNKVVIDIGSNIGDTPIYFMLRGATKVIGLEPFPKNYEIANKNIISNNLSDKITLLLAGCAAKTGHITINPNHDSNIESTLKEFSQGIKIPLLSLEQILNEYNIPSQSILKMDCEGCEYDAINSTSEQTLRRFSHIQIEYHCGYKNIKNKLEEYGFKVFVDKPRATDVINTYIEKFNIILSSHHKMKNNNHNSERKHRIGYAGFIYAINKQK